MKSKGQECELHAEETECYICGENLDGKENEVKCEGCLKSYHVACLNISHEDKLSDIRLVWICLCGNNNISVRMFDHLGIPIDVNQYECISPKQEIIGEPDSKADNCFASREKARDRKGRFVKRKRYVKKGQKRSLSPEDTNSKKRRNERYIDDLRNSSASVIDLSESLENTTGKEKELDSRWEIIRSRKARLLEKRQGNNSVDDKCQHKEECAHENTREKGVTYIGKAMKHLYYKPNRKIKDPRTKNQLKVTQEKKGSKMSVSSIKKEIDIPEASENDLKAACTGTFSHEEKELCKDGNEEYCMRSNEMAILYSKQKSPREWTSSDIDGLVTCSIDMLSNSQEDSFASICKKDDITSLGELKTGPLTDCTHQDSLLNKLEETLENCDGCLMNFGKQTFLIISDETGYYIFDGHARNRKGCQSKQGKSILMHTKTWLGVYTYCIQLSNSMKLSCDETYNLRQVKVNYRSSTDTMKCLIPTDKTSQDKVDVSLIPLQNEDHSGAKTGSNAHSKEVHVTFKQSENLKVQTEPTKPSDEVTVNIRPSITMNNWSQNYPQLSETSVDPCHELQNETSSHDNDFSTLHQELRSVTDSQPKEKVTVEETVELHRVENTQEKLLCEVSQGAENVNLSESAVVHPIVSKRKEELNQNVKLKAKPTVNVMENPFPENIQYASKLRSECPSQSDLNNKGNSKGNPIERNHQDKCSRIDTQIKYIAQGTFNQGDMRFGNSSGKQCVANSLSALLYSKVKSSYDWRSTDLDKILNNGNELYGYIRQFTSLDHEYLLISDLYKYLDSYDELFNIECCDSVSGLLDGDEMDLAICLSMPLKQALEKELCNDSDACFVTFADSTFMVISSQDGYFIFDSHSRNRRGFMVDNGYSVLLHTPSWQGVYKHCIRLAKTMGCPMNTQYEVTSVCAKANSGRNETLKGYPQIQNIPPSLIPSLSRYIESHPESSHSVQCETFDEIRTLEQSIPLQEVIASPDLFNFFENGNEELINDLRYDDQQLKPKSVRISVTKLKEPHVNHIHPLKRNDSTEVEYVNDQKENSNNCTKTGNDSELNGVDKVQVSKSPLSRKRKLSYGEINRPTTDRNIRRKSMNGVVLQPAVTYIGKAIKAFHENRKKNDGNQKKDVYKGNKNVNYERKGDISLQSYTETFLRVYAYSVKSPHSMKEYEEICAQIDKMQYRSWADVTSNSSPLSRTNSSVDTNAHSCNLFEQMTNLKKYRVHAGGKKGQVQGRNKKGQFRKKNKGIDASYCNVPLICEEDDNESVRNDKFVKKCVNSSEGSAVNHLKNSDKLIKLDNYNGKDLIDQNQKHDAMKCMNESDKGIDLNACKVDANSDEHFCNMTDRDVQTDSNANVEESEDSGSDIHIQVKHTHGKSYVESDTDTSHCEDDLVSSSLPKNDKSSQCTTTYHDDAACHISTVSDTISMKREPNKKNSDTLKRYNDCNSESSLEPLSDLNIKDEDNENAKEHTVHTCSDESGNEIEFLGTLGSCDRPDKYFQFLPLEKNEKQNICTKLNIRYVGRDCNARLGRDSCIGVPSHIKIIAGDGNCFFRAISYAISGTESNYAILRNATVEHLLETGDMFCNTLRKEFTTVREYVLERRIMEDGTWVTDTEISALANLIDTDIYSYNDQVPCWQLFSAKKPGRINVLTSDKGIYIQYTGNIHFNVVESVASVNIHSLQNTRTSEEDNVLRRTLLTASNNPDVKAKHVSKNCRSKWQFKKEIEEDKSHEKNQGHVDLKLKSDHEVESLNDNKHNMQGQTHKANPEQKCTSVNMQIKQVAQGTFNQGDGRFGFSAGKQCVANSLSALLYSKVKNANDWNSKDLDRILINGDELYRYIRRFKSLNHEYLLISDLFECLESYDELFEIEHCQPVTGLLDGDQLILAQSLSMPLKQALEQELSSDSDACFVTFGGSTLIVLYGQGCFFIFDSHSRNRRGLLTDNGYSVLLSTPSWQGVYKHCMLLAKTMGCPMCIEYEVTSVCVKALSGKNETLNGYPQLKDIFSNQFPSSNSGRQSGNSQCSTHYEGFDDVLISDESISPHKLIDSQDLLHSPEKADKGINYNVCYNGQKLKLKSVSVGLTKLKEPRLNDTCLEGNHSIKTEYVHERKRSFKNCTRYGNDSDGLNMIDGLEKFKLVSNRKRRWSNLESDAKVDIDCREEIPKSKLPKRKENDSLRIDESKLMKVKVDDNNEELMTIGETHSAMFFKPLDEIRKKECCQRLNVAYTSSICSPVVERCVPIGRPKDVRRIKADGNCFYRAVSFALTGNEENHHLLREAIVLHLLHNQDRFVSFLRTDYTSILDYVSSNSVQESGTWATEMEILVLANLIETDVYVFDEEDFRWSIFCGQNVHIGKETTEKGIYLRNTQHKHYDVILSVQSPVALNYSCESDMYELKNRIENARKSMKEGKVADCKNVSNAKSSNKKRRRKCYNKTRKYNKERMRKKRGQTKIEDANNKEENHISTANARKMKKASKKKFKYHCDLYWKSQVKQKEKERQNQKYKQDLSYRKKQVTTMRDKYHSDLQYRNRTISSKKQKYLANECYKNNKKNAMRNRYQKDESFKEVHKANFRFKYQKNENFREKRKANFRLRYQKNENFRQERIVGLKDRYHKDEQFKEIKKTVVRNRYMNNEKLRQKHKLAMKILSRTRYNKKNVRQKKLISLKVKYKRIEKYRQKVKEQNLKRTVVKKLGMSKFDNVLQEFRKIISRGPEFVCSVCFKLLFENQVLKCTKSKYKLQTCISEKYLHVCTSECSSNCQIHQSARSSLWICYTCHKKLLCGKVPAEANMNNLQLREVPDELANLNTLEQHLIALNIPFMKLMALPKGGQNGVHGPVVCVPSNTFDTVQTLPRPQTEDQLIRVKLKRKLSYKGHYEYKFVEKSKLLNALQYLKTNNKYYFDVTVNDEWENSLERNEKDNKEVVEEEVLQMSAKARLSRYWKEVLESLDNILSKDKNANENMQENNDPPSNKLDTNDIEDEEERLQGIHLDSCLQPADIGQEILDQYFDDIICCAPCEGKSPVSILQDESNEAKCFPVLFPQGRPTFHDSRNEKITLGRYLQNRLMHVDNRFAQNTDYIFYAQYIYEIQQVLGQVSIALRQSRNKKDDSSSITASDLKNAEKVQSLLRSDKGYKFLKQIRGTPPYWQKTQKDILAMVRQLGQPTFFASFSCADMRWPEIMNTLLRQKGDTRKSNELDWNEKCNLIKSNPVTVARMFDKRFHTFVNKVILSPAAPIGEIIEYVYRMEVQSRGSLHVHSLWWVKHAPKLGIDDDNEVVKFIDKYISCRKPSEEEDPELHEIISVQQHSKKHSKTCRKKGTKCRFNFPRPPSEKTFIVKPVEKSKPKKSAKSNYEVQDDSHVDCSEKNENDAKELLNSVKDALSVGTEYNSARHLFEKLGITQNQFESAHNEIASQESIIIKREPQDVWVNQFNPELLRAWNANMDLQYVTNAYACIAYIVSYMSKAEREMGMLLSHTLTEMKEGNKDAKESMKRLGQVYMQNREVSAQESVYRVCSLRLKECSRKVEFIPVGPDPVRMSLPLSIIKTRPECNDDDDDNQNIWMSSKLDRYKARPKNPEFKNMCLATFCSDYRVLTTSQVPSTRSRNIFKLSNNLGYIQKRTRTKGAVVRYPRFSPTISPESYYMSILQLFLPYYSDEQLKPPGFETYQEFYETGSVKICGCELEKVSSIVCTNRHKFEINADSIDQANKYVEQFGIQEDAWGLLCPESEVERLEHPRQRVDVEDCDEDLAIPDLNPEPKRDVYSIEFRSAKISKEDRHSLMRSLNEKQKSVFYKIRQWCLDRVNGKLVEPFHIFITGGAGTGKSHLVKCLDYEATRILARMMHHPDDVSVLKLAPTGVAAYNINGHTIHSALSIPVKAQMPYQPLNEEKISVLRNKLVQLQILIIDEVSMVDQKLMCYIHSRLRQIKQSRNQAAFAGVSVIAVGDMYQLPPVYGSPLYKDTLHGALWNDNFKKVELKDIMRQKDDTEFAFLLNRLRVKERDDILHDKDLTMLKSCETGEVCEDALHIYSCNKEVDEWNKKLLHKKCINVVCIKAEDTEKDVKNRSKVRDKPCTQLKTQLPSYLWIAVNARVMLLKNIDVCKGLTNGCFGNVEEIIMDQAKSKPVCIRVNFDKAHVGIHSVEKSEELIGNKYVRKQFPLKLAYACTIHKVQGLTLDKAVVSLKHTFQSGQAYVGLSRVTSLSGLVIENFNPKSIYCNPEIKESMDVMNPFIDENISKDSSSHTLCLILHNVQGLRQHFRDFQSQFHVVNADVFCLTETWINDDNISDVLMDNFRFYHQPRNTSYCKSGAAPSAFKELSHGGVAVYIQKPHSSRLNISVDNLEFIAVLLTKPVSVVVSVVYRPPSYNVKSFCQCLDNLLNELSKRSARCIVMGDFNEDLLKCSSQTSRLMCKRGYKQHVVSATTENGTLIDHVYSRGIDSLETQIIPTYYSYHEAIKIVI